MYIFRLKCLGKKIWKKLKDRMKIEGAKGDKWKKKLKIIKKKNENKMFQKEWILKNDRSEKKKN